MVLEVLSSIDAEKAQATHASDKEMIMGMIRTRPGGVQEFNTAIVGALRAWLLKIAKALLEEDCNADNTGLLRGVGNLETQLGHCQRRWHATQSACTSTRLAMALTT